MTKILKSAVKKTAPSTKASTAGTPRERTPISSSSIPSIVRTSRGNANSTHLPAGSKTSTALTKKRNSSRQIAAPLTLSIDIGGTGVKMMILDAKGRAKTEYMRELTPQPATHKKLLALIEKMINREPISFDRVSAGFPGVVENGVIKTAAHLHSSWVGKNFQKDLERITKKPARVANDADVQGEGDICGKGVELVITLGTGFGSALFIDGKLVPNLQLGHHPFLEGKIYEDFLAKDALEKHGVRRWNMYLKKAIDLLDKTFNYHYLYIGGGFAHKISFKLPKNVKISDNVEGILGGIKLWTN